VLLVEKCTATCTKIKALNRILWGFSALSWYNQSHGCVLVQPGDRLMHMKHLMSILMEGCCCSHVIIRFGNVYTHRTISHACQGKHGSGYITSSPNPISPR